MGTKTGAITAHFAEHYEYRFGIKFHRESDPMTQFLEEKRHGH